MNDSPDPIHATSIKWRRVGKKVAKAIAFILPLIAGLIAPFNPWADNPPVTSPPSQIDRGRETISPVPTATTTAPVTPTYGPTVPESSLESDGRIAPMIPLPDDS